MSETYIFRLLQIQLRARFTENAPHKLINVKDGTEHKRTDYK
jgi:hypothetical protein